MAQHTNNRINHVSMKDRLAGRIENHAIAYKLDYDSKSLKGNPQKLEQDRPFRMYDVALISIHKRKVVCECQGKSECEGRPSQLCIDLSHVQEGAMRVGFPTLPMRQVNCHKSMTEHASWHVLLL